LTQQPPADFHFSFDLRAERLLRHQKRALFGAFTLHSDEGERLGGDNTAPPPLAYFAAALAF
jgi:hypothetical protein